MGEAREWWANVYGPRDGLAAGTHQVRHETRAKAENGCLTGTGKPHPALACRIHVRLKPEGAPRRYINAEQRRAYETKQWPEIMAYQRSLGL